MTLATGLSIDIDERKGGREREREEKNGKEGKRKRERRGMGVEITRASSPSSPFLPPIANLINGWIHGHVFIWI